MDYSAFTSKIIKWFEKTERDLPWRGTNDPYKIWLSEIILQQTRVSQGTPYYFSFVESFPTVQALANADEELVLRKWQGLGYYSRARNLHKCAKQVCEYYDGIFPESYDDLLKLPGIGPYTAAAIASIAFNLPHAVMDGNVQRVLARYLGIKENIAEGKVQKKIQIAANELIDPNKPGEFNQAIMDLGATVCVPANPQCDDCPVAESCYALSNSLQQVLPNKVKKIKRRKRYFYYWVFQYQGKISLQKRGEGDIWNGLYEFKMTEQKHKNSWEELLHEEFPFLDDCDVIIKDVYEFKKHVLSHQDIHSTFITIDINKSLYDQLKLNYSYQFYSHDQIVQLPKPILIDKFLREKII